MSYNLTITAVSPNAREWRNNHGTFKDYTVTVKNISSGNTRDVSWSRKKRDDGTFPEPQVGDQIEAEIVASDFPPSWKLKGVKFNNTGDGINIPQHVNGNKTGGTQDEFRRSKKQMTIEAADSTAATLMLALASGGPWSDMDEFWGEFQKMSTTLQARAVLDAKVESQPKPLPENRRDIERTGESDVPTPGQGEFVHAAPDGSDHPFNEPDKIEF